MTLLTHAPDLTALVVAAVLFVGGPAAGFGARVFFRRESLRAADARSATWSIVHGGLQLLAPVTLSIGGVWAAARSLPLTPEIAAAVDILLKSILIVALTVCAARLAGALVRSYATKQAGVQASSIFVSVTWFLVGAVGVLITLQTLGISITPLLTALGVGGLAVALALQDTLANLFAGIQILASKKVRPGDYIQLDSGQEGYIVDITWRNTLVRQLSNNVVLVPNAKLSTAVVVNFYKPLVELAVPVELGVSGKTDLEHVEQVTVDVARDVMRSVQGGIPDHQPFLRFASLTDAKVGFQVVLRAREYSDQYMIRHEFIKRLHSRYRAEAIESA